MDWDLKDQPDEGLKAMQTSHVQVVQVLIGSIIRACVRKFRDSLQALICTIQYWIGDDTRTIEGVQLEEFPCVTLLVVTHEALKSI